MLIEKSDIANYIGHKSEPTDWFTVTQEQINTFAKCTHDEQFIHVDPEAAKKTPFGTTIAHGFLSLSMLSYFMEQASITIKGCYMGVNYGCDKVRFISPVKVNSRIRAHVHILDIIEKKPGQYQLTAEVTLEIEGEEKPALIAQWLMLQMVK